MRTFVLNDDARSHAPTLHFASTVRPTMFSCSCRETQLYAADVTWGSFTTCAARSPGIASSTVAFVQPRDNWSFPQCAHFATFIRSGARTRGCLFTKSSAHRPSRVVPSAPHSTQNAMPPNDGGAGHNPFVTP